jgi:hypothetical protein
LIIATSIAWRRASITAHTTFGGDRGCAGTARSDGDDGCSKEDRRGSDERALDDFLHEVAVRNRHAAALS